PRMGIHRIRLDADGAAGLAWPHPGATRLRDRDHHPSRRERLDACGGALRRRYRDGDRPALHRATRCVGDAAHALHGRACGLAPVGDRALPALAPQGAKPTRVTAPATERAGSAATDPACEKRLWRTAMFVT